MKGLRGWLEIRSTAGPTPFSRMKYVAYVCRRSGYSLRSSKSMYWSSDGQSITYTTPTLGSHTIAFHKWQILAQQLSLDVEQSFQNICPSYNRDNLIQGMYNHLSNSHPSSLPAVPEHLDVYQTALQKQVTLAFLHPQDSHGLFRLEKSTNEQLLEREQAFLAKFLVYFLLTCGVPPRAPTVVGYQLKDLLQMGEEFVLAWGKEKAVTAGIRDEKRGVLHVIPISAGKALVSYLTYIRPFTDRVRALAGFQVDSDSIFVDSNGRWGTDSVREHLRSMAGRLLGPKICTNILRQVMQSVFSRQLPNFLVSKTSYKSVEYKDIRFARRNTFAFVRVSQSWQAVVGVSPCREVTSDGDAFNPAFISLICSIQLARILSYLNPSTSVVDVWLQVTISKVRANYFPLVIY
jgi:hypothetical protein